MQAHKLIRRVKPAPIVAVAQAPSKLRVTSDRLKRLAADKQAILEDLKSISEADEAIDRAQSAKEVCLARIEERMREHNMTVTDNGKLIAEIVEGFTRQSRTIDPKKFRNKVGAADFWACIDVSVTRASRVLAEKELNGISDVVPAKSLGYSLKVREMKKK